MIIHDMESSIQVGNTFNNPKFCGNRGKFRTFDRVVANQATEFVARLKSFTKRCEEHKLMKGRYMPTPEEHNPVNGRMR